MIDNLKVTVIIAAAGSSNRMNSPINKTFIMIDNKPVLLHAIEKFENSNYVDNIIIVARDSEIEYVEKNILELSDCKKISHVISGGDSRQKSISNALKVLDPSTDIVLTHDGARPFVHVETINRALEEVLVKRAVVVGVKVKDTIKSVNDEDIGKVHLTPNRSLLWAAQSPQVFYYRDILNAYEYSEREHINATDDSSLVEKIGIPVYMVAGTYDNIKITTPEDLVLARMFIESYRKGENEIENRTRI